MKTWHRVIVGFGSLVLLATIAALWWFHAAHPPSNPADHQMVSLSIHGTIIQTEVVSVGPDVEEGLSDRSSMPKEHGMLFEMGPPDYYSFWMQRMHFPLDIIWINGKHVVEIAPDLPAPGLFGVPVAHMPKAKANRVLELNAGVSKELNLQVGDSIGGLY